MRAIKSCEDKGKEEESVKLGILVGVSLTPYKALLLGQKGVDFWEEISIYSCLSSQACLLTAEQPMIHQCVIRTALLSPQFSFAKLMF